MAESYASFHARQEQAEFGKWAETIKDRLWIALRQVARARWVGRGDCWPVMVSGKDGDLTEAGCVGIADIQVQNLDEVWIAFRQHWAQDWCDTCDMAHAIWDSDPGCEFADGDCDHLEESAGRVFPLPAGLQEDPQNAEAAEALALTVLDQLAEWAWTD